MDIWWFGDFFIFQFKLRISFQRGGLFIWGFTSYGGVEFLKMASSRLQKKIVFEEIDICNWKKNHLKNRIRKKYYTLKKTFIKASDALFRVSIRNRVLCSGMLLYLHHRNSKLFFHPAKFDSLKDETISAFKTVLVSQSKNLLDWKLLV